MHKPVGRGAASPEEVDGGGCVRNGPGAAYRDAGTGVARSGEQLGHKIPAPIQKVDPSRVAHGLTRVVIAGPEDLKVQLVSAGPHLDGNGRGKPGLRPGAWREGVKSREYAPECDPSCSSGGHVRMG